MLQELEAIFSQPDCQSARISSWNYN